MDTLASKPADAKRVPQNDHATARIDRLWPSVIVLLQTQFFSPIDRKNQNEDSITKQKEICFTFTCPKFDQFVWTTWCKSKYNKKKEDPCQHVESTNEILHCPCWIPSNRPYSINRCVKCLQFNQFGNHLSTMFVRQQEFNLLIIKTFEHYIHTKMFY